MTSSSHSIDDIVALAKRRGFIFPSSEIYGGLANTYDYGPYGTELMRNLKNFWWHFFVTSRPNIYGVDTAILMSPKVWEASGHTTTFADALVECKTCHQRTRADHLIETYYHQQQKDTKVEGQSVEQLDQLIQSLQLKCPHCGQFNWTKVRRFNLLFQTHIGIVPEKQSLTYLRGETAQGMFVDFKNIVQTLSPKLPFGLAQMGKVFRNEITKGHSIFRTLEFDLAEFEYFIKPDTWQETFTYWRQEIDSFVQKLGINPQRLRWRSQTPAELSHYSSRTDDLEYQFPFGFGEWYAVAYRSDFDLSNHSKKSQVDLSLNDPISKTKFMPHVIEPTFGLSRTLLVILNDAYTKDPTNNQRLVLKIAPHLSPVKVAVFPLLKNKPDLVNYAHQVFSQLSSQFAAAWDDRGNIGKRYFSQDEIGTPFCVTVDFESLKANSVTVRNRDSAAQTRIATDQLQTYLNQQLNQL